MTKVKLNLGSGVWLRGKGFINVDNFFTEEEVRSKKGRFANAVIEPGAKFVKADIKAMPFKDNSVDYIEMHQVIEHFPMYRVIEYMKEIYRVMKPGAKLIISCPYFTGLAIDWLQMVSSQNFDPKAYYEVAETIFGNQYGDSEGEVHRCPFTVPFMNYVLNGGGFTKGTMFIVPKGAKIPVIGTLKPPTPNSVARNDLMIVEAIK
jgi:SAM-dependent methyltransferase